MHKMKISIIAPDLSHNCLGRAYLIAKVLQKQCVVEIVGATFGEATWGTVSEDKSIEYKTVKIHGTFAPYYQLFKLMKMIDGDVIYVSKPLPSSFILGLICKLITGKKIVLDIDDWQMGFLKDYVKNLGMTAKARYFSRSLVKLYSLNSWWGTLLCNSLTKFTDGIVVSNSFLNQMYGGVIIPHVRDTEYFKPEEYSTVQRNIVAFLGTPREHKGIVALLEALIMTKSFSTITLLLLGFDPANEFHNKVLCCLEKKMPGKYIALGVTPFSALPEFLAASDVVAIPQEDTLSTIGQIPAKLFDAMAMGKPIVATSVNDIPKVLDGCGWVVPPNDCVSLSEAIDNVLNNREEALRIGKKAREKSIKEYSYASAERVLLPLLQHLYWKSVSITG